MISGSKSGSTTFLSAAASVASGAATPAISAHLHEERLFFGEDLRVGVVVQGDGLHGALADADPAALAGGRLDLGLLGLHVDDRHLVGADAHAREAGCAFVLVDLGDDAAGLDDGLGQDGGGPPRGGVGLADRLLDALGVVGGAAEEEALAGEVDGAQLDMSLEVEAVAGERHLEQFAELAATLGRNGRRGQHEQVERRLDVAPQVRVAVGDRHGTVGAHLRQAVVVVAREDDAELTRLGVVLLQQAEGADLLEPHVHRPPRVLLLEPDGVLDALLAAGARTVGVAVVERAGAEHEAHRLDVLEGRVVFLEHALQVEPGDHLLAFAEAVELGAVFARARGHHDDAVIDRRARAVLLLDDAREVADEAVEVGELGLEVDLDVGVVDELLLELLDELGGVVALDGVAELEHETAELVAALHEVRLVTHVAGALGDMGHETHLVERSDKLGGLVLELGDTIKGNDPTELVKQLEQKLVDNPNVKIHLEAELADFHGFIGNFSSVIKDKDGKRTPVDHGVVVVATGSREDRPELYGLGESQKVITGLDLERMLKDDDPALKNVKSVGFVLCAGSLDETHPYCSRTCCQQSIKNAIRLKEQDPRRPVYVWFKEIRTYGLLEEYYTKARELGVIFTRYDNDSLPQVSANGSVSVAYRDPYLRRDVEMPLDLLVLATPSIAADGGSELSKLLKVPLTSDGFYLEAHVKLRPVDFSSEGIFLCGSAHYPKGIEETISQAYAAAGRAAGILAKPVIKAGGVVAEVDEDKCAACLTCVRICPYEVPIIDMETKKAKIEAAACQGCGICVSECPAKAVTLHHYTDAQIFAKEEALFMEVS